MTSVFLGADAHNIANAEFVPLGDNVTEAHRFIADLGPMKKDRIPDGLPHPSGANAERIASEGCCNQTAFPDPSKARYC